MARATFDDVVLFARTGLNPRKNFVLGNGTNKYITIKNIYDNKLIIDENTDLVNDEAIRLIHKRSKIKKGDILFCSIGRLGDMYIIDEEPNGWDINESVFAFTLNENIIRQKYFYYYFKSRRIINYLNKRSSGSTFKSIKMEQLKKMTFDLPTLEKQDYVIKVLDSIVKIINDDFISLHKLDGLSKARFDEMFGEKTDYPQEQLGNNVQEMFIGPFGSALKNDCFVDPKDAYCIVYEQKHAIKKTMDVPTRYVNKEKYEELKRFSIHPGDIIVSCRGTIGEVFVVPDNAPLGIMHPSIMKIRLNAGKYDQKFFIFALEKYMNEHNSEANGSSVKMAITASSLKQELFVIPPIDIQKQFSDYIVQINQAKDTIQKSIDKTQLLFNSLMQEYFG